MFALVALIIFGLIVAFFATQNTAPISIMLANYQLPNVPTYFVALGGMLVGVIASWIISLFGAVSSSMKLHGKNSKISALSNTTSDLQKKVQDLEVENAKLRGERDADRPKLGFLQREKKI